MTAFDPLAIAAASMTAAAAVFVSGRLFAKKNWLVESPGERSSHKVPTPRTGGVAIALGFLAACLSLSLDSLSLARFASLFAAAFLLGVIDDARPLPAALKLIGQIAIAALFVWLFGAIEQVPAPFVGDLALGVAAPALTVFWIVAFMNAFNFMDGANGIASTAAIFALSALGVAAAGAGIDPWAPASIILAAAIFGFLPLNFPKARLFMGDGGSQSIGFSIAALAALSASVDQGAVSALFMPTVFMPFLFDVAFTLAHRIARRRNFAEAHNEHLYQLIVRLGASHTAVTTLYVGLIMLSTFVAIIAGALPGSVQFLAPAGLLAAFLFPAMIVFRKAAEAGLLVRAKKESAPLAASFAKAAE